MKLKVIILILMTALVVTPVIHGEGDALLSVENQYIKVFLNNSNDAAGRFAVDVTGGDAGRTDDDGKPLIYGHPKPWTSYTTIRVNGENFVFGKATAKRSGAGLPGGEVIVPPKVDNNRIIMQCKYGAVTAEQILDITSSPTTGAKDTARIKYVIRNTGNVPAEVGLRAVLDTMVGSNDGAPFRLGSQEITYEHSANAGEYPDFWQAFDSLEHPSVIAQGTLKGGDVTPPDQFIIADWGKMADHAWDLPIQPGNPFIRQGEDELDSAVALFWFPRKIDPGKEFSIVIYYGLGGVTFAPGNTFLGISAPAEVQYSGENSRSYTIVLYMEHHGEANAKNVKVHLDLPAGLEEISGKPDIEIPELSPGVTKQFSWEIRATGLYSGDTSFRIQVTGDGLEANEVNRRIKILQPPLLAATLLIPVLKVETNQWVPNPMTVSLELKNIDELAAKDLHAELICTEGVKLAGGEHPERIIADLDAGQKNTVSWKIEPIRGVKNGTFKIRLNGSNILPLEIPGKVTIPPLPFALNFSVPDNLRLGQVFSAELIAYNLFSAQEFTIDVRYNPSQLKLVYLSRGTLLVENGQLALWSEGTLDSRAGWIRDITGKRSQPFNGETTTVFRLNFMVVGTGEGEIDLPKVNVINSEGEVLPYEFTPVKYQIKEETK